MGGILVSVYWLSGARHSRSMLHQSLSKPRKLANIKEVMNVTFVLNGLLLAKKSDSQGDGTAMEGNITTLFLKEGCIVQGAHTCHHGEYLYNLTRSMCSPMSIGVTSALDHSCFIVSWGFISSFTRKKRKIFVSCIDPIIRSMSKSMDANNPYIELWNPLYDNGSFFLSSEGFPYIPYCLCVLMGIFWTSACKEWISLLREDAELWLAL